MPLPWMAIVDGLLGATDLVRRVRGRGDLAPSSASSLEARLAGVVVSALREAFDRDSQRLEIERQRVEEEQQRREVERVRAERALRLELLRQAGEREIGRLRMLTGVAVFSWLGAMVMATRVSGGLARVFLGLGVVLFIGGVAAVFSAQSHVGRVLARLDNRTHADEFTASTAGAIAPWLVVAGLATSALAILIA
jgi:predicted phage tail protein